MSPIPAVLDVQSRISEIESRMGIRQAGAGAAFGATLASAVGKTGAAGASGTSGNDVVAAAKKYIGVPYLYGGTDPTKGLDCSGLVQRVYKDLGINLPRTAADQARQGTAVSSLAEAKPGDLVAFGQPVDHIGIYIGDNKMIAAPSRGQSVKIQEVYEKPTAIRRIVSDAPAAMSAASFGGSNSAIKGNLHSQYDNLFVQAGAKYGISPNLLAGVAKAESNFNARAKSGAGAQGLMQIMPGTARGLGVNAMDPAQAVDGAAKMLSGLIKKFGSVELALAGYNAGPGAVQKYNGIPPYKETQNYVRKIMNFVR